MPYTLPYKKFGLASTYSPFTNSYPTSKTIDITMSIPESTPFADEPYVVLETGLIPEANAFFNRKLKFIVINKNGQQVSLSPRIGTAEVGQSLFPDKNEIVWFDIQGLQGDYFIHSDYAGASILIQGEFMASALEANVFNNLVTTTSDDINSLQKNIDNVNNTLRQERVKLEVIQQVYNWSNSGFSSRTGIDVSTTFYPPSGVFLLLGYYINNLSFTASYQTAYPIQQGSVTLTIGECVMTAHSGSPYNGWMSASYSNSVIGGGRTPVNMTARGYTYTSYPNRALHYLYPTCKVTTWWLKQVNY